MTVMNISNRTALLKITSPELWKYVLSSYYLKHMNRLKLHSMLKHMRLDQISSLAVIFPEIITVPPALSGLELKLWFCTKRNRAYLLGFNLIDNLPCDEAISYQLQELH